MKIFINGNEDSSTYDQPELGNLLDQIQKDKLEKGQFLFKIKVNDQDIEFGSEDFRETPTANIQKLEIETSSLATMVNENIDNGILYLSKLTPGLEQVAAMLRAGQHQEANSILLDIVDGVDWFSQLIELVIQAKDLDVETVQYNGKNLMERKSQLVGLTENILASYQGQDWVKLADLLEFEFLPYYQDWSEVLPQIKGD